MYNSVGENRILPSFGMDAHEEIKEMPMCYLEETRDDPSQRALGMFIVKIRREYGAMVEIDRMGKLQDILNFKRKPEWIIRVFWQKLRRIHLYAKQHGVVLPMDIAFAQTLHALNLSSSQKQLAVSHFETVGLGKTIQNLQSVTIKFFIAY